MQDAVFKGIALDLSLASQEALALMMDETADMGLYDEILVANKDKIPVVKMVYDHPRTPDDVRARAANVLRAPVLSHTQIEKLKQRDKEARAKVADEVRKESLTKKVQRLGVGEKIKMAQTGNGEVRGVLLRDSNKMVCMTVMANPKLTDAEVEAVARNRSIFEEALRLIVKNKEWMKNYSIMNSIVNNPKTPPPLAIGQIKFLKKRDLNKLEKNKNVSEVVRNTAKKLVKKRQSG